jgi:hypothetical protein
MKVTNIKSSDIFLINVNVGQLPPRKAKEHMQEIKDALKEHFKNEMILIASKSLQTEIEILRIE